MKLNLLVLLLLCGCSTALPLGMIVPKLSGNCAANGVHVRVTLPDGKSSYSAGCIQQQPVPGNPGLPPPPPVVPQDDPTPPVPPPPKWP